MAGMSSVRRIALLDEIRGFCILCMIFYHGFFLLGSAAGIPFMEKCFHFFLPVQPLFAAVFIIISGICTQFSRNILKRGSILLLISIAISVITVWILPQFSLNTFQDKFGILHLLSVCMLLYAANKRWSDKMPVQIIASICIVGFLLTFRLENGIIGFWHLPQSIHDMWFLFPLGIHTDTFISADYFPLLPYGFLFGFGICLGRSVFSQTLPEGMYRVHFRPLSFLGRKSLWFYLLHIPILYSIVLCIERF